MSSGIGRYFALAMTVKHNCLQDCLCWVSHSFAHRSSAGALQTFSHMDREHIAAANKLYSSANHAPAINVRYEFCALILSVNLTEGVS